MRGGAGLQLLSERMGETVARAGASPHAAALDAAVRRVVEVTAALWGTGDPAVALANASAYLEAVGHVVVAWMWLEQLVAVGDSRGAFYDGKRAAAQWFFTWELPKALLQLDVLERLDRTVLDVADDAL